MNFFSYVVEHDFGLAPNPFGGYCTLAVCKPNIRDNSALYLGDWVIGTGSAKYGKSGYLIYAMQVTEKLNFNQYWSDPRFQYKKPITNGSLTQLFGDNFYHQDNNGKWVQEKGAHSKTDAEKHLSRDTKSSTVLISNNFYYLGDNAIKIPNMFSEIIKIGPGMKYKDLDKLGLKFLKWLKSKATLGISGDPNNWDLSQNSSQIKLDL